MTDAATADLIESLRCADVYPHDTDKIQVVETHISYVVLTGCFAYKIKKPIELPFVDFSSLDRRHHFCCRELALNRRFASELYLDTVPIGGTPDEPTIGSTPPIEFAVKMRQFGQTADALVGRGELTRGSVVSLAERIVSFHASLDAATGRSPVESIIQNLDELERALATGDQRNDDDQGSGEKLRRIRAWAKDSNVAIEQAFAERQERGLVRDCHGDLHLGNVAWVNDKLMPFDCLEFDDELRTIDVIDEIAFLAMDLIAHARQDLAYAFVDAYLHATGDYEGLRVWRYYCVHRALVRAKVQRLASDTSAGSAGNISTDPYLTVAGRLAGPASPLLIITMGLSGSGKTTVTDELIGLLPAIRIRSDIERKRLHDVPESASSDSGVGGGIYSESADDATYACLYDAAQSALAGGISMIVDASFLDRKRRREFRELAVSRGARFVILSFTAPEATLRERIERRTKSRADASEADVAVLRRQIDRCDPLDEREREMSIDVDTTRIVDAHSLVGDINRATRLRP